MITRVFEPFNLNRSRTLSSLTSLSVMSGTITTMVSKQAKSRE